MSAGRPRRSLADLKAEHAARQPQLDDATHRAVHLAPHRTLRDAIPAPREAGR